jgi:hypothetical protein
VPVLNAGLFANVREIDTEFGFGPAHPLPLQAPGPTVTTLVVEVVTTDCEQPLPRVALLQVYVRSELAIDGPLAGEKSLAALTTSVLLPEGLVRTLYCMVSAPVKLANAAPVFSKLTLGCTTESLAWAPRFALSVCPPVTELARAAGLIPRNIPRITGTPSDRDFLKWYNRTFIVMLLAISSSRQLGLFCYQQLPRTPVP